ncbi:MAG: DUF3472 domain-containing protein [Planctomycetes bacterium]|nr:DUF3472 domain-containing protein [Planctomycetota bacterium]
MVRLKITAIAIAATLLWAAQCAAAQHLWWETEKLDDATCLYGEVTVLATHHGIYYCGANWHPGEPAGGYCGIQHNGPKERRTIFSIWDTSPKLHPNVTQADPKTIFNRFGGEGEGAHTHMLWDWQAGETFQFFVQKQPGSAAGTTDARYYVYDRWSRKWRHSATITSPDGDAKSGRSVRTIGGGGLGSFLENFVGKDRAVPKLALYRLWLGSKVDAMTCLTRAQGDGTWGQLHDSYFLAEGESKDLSSLFGKVEKRYGKPTFGQEGTKLAPISDRPLPAELVKQLQTLPQARRVQNK